MNRLKTKSTKICFVIVLSLSLLLSAIPVVPAAAADETTGTTTSYTYSVEITFGSLSFVYDWGTWSTSHLRYEADNSSTNPASGTEQGFPGWYGFDGTANKVSVKYLRSETDTTQYDNLSVTLEYAPLTGTSAVGGVEMELFQSKDFSSDSQVKGTNSSFTLTIQNNKATDYWISLKGVPMSGSNSFDSDTLTAIGTLTFRLGKLSPGSAS